MIATRDIYIRQGNTFTHKLVITNGTSAVDLSRSTFNSEIRTSGETSLSSTGDLFQNANGTVFSVFDASVAGNVVTFTLPSNRSDIISPGKHKYDMQQIRPDGTVETLLSGEVVVMPKVSS